MGTLDLTSAVDRVRLAVGDYQDLEIFPDNVYEYVLDKHEQNETASIKEMATLILGALSQSSSRSRLDRIEVYTGTFEQYFKFLKEVIKNPNGAYSNAGIYAAGIYVQDVLDNQADTEIVQRRLPINGPLGEYTALYIDPEDTF